MWTPKSFRRERVVVQLCLLTILAMPSSGTSRQALPTQFAEAGSPPRERTLSKSPKSPLPDRLPHLPKEKIAAGQITSFFIRANDSKRIQLSMLIGYQQEFTQAVRQLLREKVTPLLLSVSTLPNRVMHFDPTLLRFEQRGRIWQPNALKNATDVWPLEEGSPFGGAINEGQVHQGVILLPEWFNPAAPITVRYGDFHYLARFVK